MEIARDRLLEKRDNRWSRGYNALSPALLELAAADRRAERRSWRLAIAAGVLFHVVLFIVTFPELKGKVYHMGGGGQTRVYRLQRITFQPPPARQVQRAPARSKAKRIPIPDPTPLDPEPVYDEAVEGEGVDAQVPAAGMADVLGVPDGPPGMGSGPYQIGGAIKAPERVFAADPVYPEEAREGRVQGVVILQTIIDTSGKVSNVRVLKGLPSGLTESAVEAVRQWRFRPATLEGKPVAVYYLVTVTFSVQ